MVGSVWRFAHLVLALFSFIFLLIASITGVILALDVVNEKTNHHQIDNFKDINLAQSITGLREVYPEILEVKVDQNQAVIVAGFNDEGEDFEAIVNPLTGEKVGEPHEKSEFIQWTTSLHRSLFLHETGRFIVGFVSFLLMLIVVSGSILIIKRQQGVRYFLSKIKKDFFAQYFHVAAGRLLLIPILLISLTGTYLFLLRFEVISKPENVEEHFESTNNESLEILNFPVFIETKLSDVEKIEFPFSDDPEEFFKVKTKDKEFLVNQITGQVVSETQYSNFAILETLSLDIHTGRTSALWSIILAIASLNILFFIYSGFVITWKRTATKVKNKFKPQSAEIVILVGSENGSTAEFANTVHKQLLLLGKKSYITNLNQYALFPEAKQFLIFTSTYGLGEAPSNAKKFKKLLIKYPQKQEVQYSVVGFGSTAYKDFCVYASEIDVLLNQQTWSKQQTKLHTINNRSVSEFLTWIKELNVQSNLNLPNVAAIYEQKRPKLQKLTLIDNFNKNIEEGVFELTLQPKKFQKFQSGDLLAIYPHNSDQERLYSIAKVNGKIKLVVKLHEFGLGSQYLSNTKKGDVVFGRVIHNDNFHFPDKKPSVFMIANGTGIAPFIGMIHDNNSKTNVHLYAGFRYRNQTSLNYEDRSKIWVLEHKLTDFKIAYSRQNESQYVMDLIRKDGDLFAKELEKGSVIMICGSLAMQRDVELVLDAICIEKNNKKLLFYKDNNQLLTDCY